MAWSFIPLLPVLRVKYLRKICEFFALNVDARKSGNLNQSVGKVAHLTWSSSRPGMLHFQRVSPIGANFQ